MGYSVHNSALLREPEALRLEGSATGWDLAQYAPQLLHVGLLAVRSDFTLIIVIIGYVTAPATRHPRSARQESVPKEKKDPRKVSGALGEGDIK